MGMLTGDIEASVAAGSILPEHAQRLWTLLPQTVDAMLKRGPSLIDVLVHGDSLLARTEGASPENVNRLRRLKELIERKKTAVSGRIALPSICFYILDGGLRVIQFY
jgi:hypothetical protein